MAFLQRRPFLRRLSSLLGLASLCALLISPPGAGADAPAPRGQFGVDGHVVFANLPQQGWGQHLAKMYDTGVRYVRVAARWDAVEPEPPTGGEHHFNWVFFDSIARELAAHHLRWFPILVYSPAWEQGGFGSTPAQLPANPADFGSYAAGFASRYGVNGIFWQANRDLPYVPVTAYEIWNEPNSDVLPFGPHPDAARFAASYVAARNSIHLVDPHGQAVVGGLAADNGAFLRQMVAAVPELLGHMDAVGLHAYAATPDGAVAALVDFRRVLDDLGEVQTPIDITEFGWPTQGTGPQTISAVSDSDRARFMTSELQVFARSDCGVERTMPYAWVTPQQNSSDAEDWFGIVNPDLSLSATGAAVTDALRRLTSGPDAVVAASMPLCGRAPGIGVTTRVLRSRSHARGHRRGFALVCATALATLRSTALSDANVSFRLSPARRTRARKTTTAKTDGSGRAVACFRRRPGEAVRRRLLSVSATREDLALRASTAQWILLR